MREENAHNRRTFVPKLMLGYACVKTYKIQVYFNFWPLLNPMHESKHSIIKGQDESMKNQLFKICL